MFRDGGDVVGAQVVGGRVRARFRLVADQVVPVGRRGVEGGGEELRDEGGGEGEGEDLWLESIKAASASGRTDGG